MVLWGSFSLLALFGEDALLFVLDGSTGAWSFVLSCLVMDRRTFWYRGSLSVLDDFLASDVSYLRALFRFERVWLMIEISDAVRR